MSDAAVIFPHDADARRRLWRAFVHDDVPATPRVVAVRREPRDAWLPAAVDAPPAVTNGFARAVRESMVGDQLPYGDRVRLLTRAARLGLSRFEANLVIAAVIHRSDGEATHRPTRTHGRLVPGVATATLAILAAEAAAIVAFVLW